MYVIDIRHHLNDKGDIEPGKGPACKMADFITSVITHASEVGRLENAPGPLCFKCRKRDNCRVLTGVAADETVTWYCPACGTEGRISNWQGTFWNLRAGIRSDLLPLQ